MSISLIMHGKWYCVNKIKRFIPDWLLLTQKLFFFLFTGTSGKQIKGGYLLRYKSKFLSTHSFSFVWQFVHSFCLYANGKFFSIHVHQNSWQLIVCKRKKGSFTNEASFYFILHCDTQFFSFFFLSPHNYANIITQWGEKERKKKSRKNVEDTCHVLT